MFRGTFPQTLLNSAEIFKLLFIIIEDKDSPGNLLSISAISFSKSSTVFSISLVPRLYSSNVRAESSHSTRNLLTFSTTVPFVATILSKYWMLDMCWVPVLRTAFFNSCLIRLISFF